MRRLCVLSSEDIIEASHLTLGIQLRVEYVGGTRVSSVLHGCKLRDLDMRTMTLTFRDTKNGDDVPVALPKSLRSPRRHRTFRAVLYRDCHQPLPDDRAASFHFVGGGVLGPDPGLSPGRHARAAASHPDVHELVLLGLSRQGAGRHRVSLKQPQQLGYHRSGILLLTKKRLKWGQRLTDKNMSKNYRQQVAATFGGGCALDALGRSATGWL